MLQTNNTYFFRSLTLRMSLLATFAENAQLGLPIAYPSKQLCRIKMDGEELIAAYDLLSSEPDDFAEFEDVECLGPAEIVGVKYMSLAEIVEEMRDLDLFVPAILLKGKRVGA